MNISIPTYIINLKYRTDRLEHIQKEFENKPEFNIEIIEAVQHKIGSYGLWLSLKKVLEKAIDNEDDVIVFVEDDHTFTENYQWDYLLKNIIDANKQGVDILLGGIGGGFKNVVPITKNRFWIDSFWCTQFTIIYKRFYHKILETEFTKDDAIDRFLSRLTTNKMTLYPYISIQKDFGYSDATSECCRNTSISTYFQNSDQILSLYAKAFERFNIMT
ncbi:glycosyltransferase family 25 protein [Capnocytophaga canimorsus]|uniref:glycosyltransferase family 25 protein n=1 Tax=Capnocytophaga canimorsus TaxID=28188 RepID=UPI001EE01844|nr:glycosyltransferase family 25 protein [Capnocytophaga canimorsus]GJQ04854.1 glycosyl transferase [Capnocytophaga canimorsus]